MLTGIYKFTNILNGHSYIGQAVNIERRYREHIARAYSLVEKYQTNSLYRAIRKYGIEYFSFQIIEVCPKEKLDDRERYWIDYYNTYNNGYNQDSGGRSQKDTYIKHSKDKVTALKNDLKLTQLSFDELHKKYGVSIGYVSDINKGNIHYSEGDIYPLRKKEYSLPPSKTCPICGKMKDSHANMCLDCFRKSKTIPIDRQVLKKLIRTTSFVQIGKQYNVSDNTIRKWCKKLNLPYQSRKINSYSEEEWKMI